MTIEFLIKANKIISAGLRMPAKFEGEPHPAAPDVEWNSTLGRLEPEQESEPMSYVIDDMVPETHIDPGVAKHYEQMRQEKRKVDDDMAALAAIPVVPCPWVCPTTCLNCGIENCADRLAGGAE